MCTKPLFLVRTSTIAILRPRKLLLRLVSRLLNAVKYDHALLPLTSSFFDVAVYLAAILCSAFDSKAPLPKFPPRSQLAFVLAYAA
jgi:hypothetical protein